MRAAGVWWTTGIIVYDRTDARNPRAGVTDGADARAHADHDAQPTVATVYPITTSSARRQNVRQNTKTCTAKTGGKMPSL